MFDIDDSKTIEKEEAVKHWSKNFGKISANEFFNSVDYNHDGMIEYDEFVDFWMIVKGAGHSEDEIKDEVGVYLMTGIACQNTEWRIMGRV